MQLKPNYNLPVIMTVDEVAEFFRMSTETIRRMDRAGELSSIKGLPVKRYHRDTVLALLDCGGG
jgi:hypothetical protein